MPRVTIQQFRAVLTGRSEEGSLPSAYRELARRPDLAAGMGSRGWIAWPEAASAAGAEHDPGALVHAYRRLARRPDLTAENLRGDWGPWTGSPTTA
jgi:hypothetical protein